MHLLFIAFTDVMFGATNFSWVPVNFSAISGYYTSGYYTSGYYIGDYYSSSYNINV